MTEDELRLRIRGVVHGAVVNYIKAHGMELKSTSNVNSLEKRIVGAVLGAVKTGQWEGYIGTDTVCDTRRADGTVHAGAEGVPAGAG